MITGISQVLFFLGTVSSDFGATVASGAFVAAAAVCSAFVLGTDVAIVLGTDVAIAVGASVGAAVGTLVGLGVYSGRSCVYIYRSWTVRRFIAVNVEAHA